MRSRKLAGLECRQLHCRALNQAIGRCIRHKHDYGGIILLDQRFGDTRNQRNLSCWCAALHLPLSWRSHCCASAIELLDGPTRAMHTRRLCMQSGSI